MLCQGQISSQCSCRLLSPSISSDHQVGAAVSVSALIAAAISISSDHHVVAVPALPLSCPSLLPFTVKPSVAWLVVAELGFILVSHPSLDFGACSLRTKLLLWSFQIGSGALLAVSLDLRSAFVVYLGSVYATSSKD